MRQHKPLPPVDFLREIFEYNPDTGLILYKTNFHKNKVGTQAGTNTHPTGYRFINIKYNGKKVLYSSARVAWALHYGEDPGELTIDHINRRKQDDRVCNLRLATFSENQLNRVVPNRSTGEKYIRKSRNHFMVMGPGRTYIGQRPTLEEAIKLRDDNI
jgi:hypothetical protein